MGYTVNMEFSKKIISAIIILVMFCAFYAWNFICNTKQKNIVLKVVSPVELILDNNRNIKFEGIETFYPDYTENNAILARKLNMSDNEAFIYGCFGKYWAKNLIEKRKITVLDDDLKYYKFGYKARLLNSPFAFMDGKPSNEQAFNRQLSAIRRGNFVILDLDTDLSYPISKENRKKAANFVVVRKTHIKNVIQKEIKQKQDKTLYKSVFESGNIKIIVSDLTSKIKPDRNCSSDICKELLSSINSAKCSIDMAIYGYSSTPKIEKALKSAITRGVKIRLVYDEDIKGNNIYQDTAKLVEIVSNSISDRRSPEANSTMHNKFYIFDNKKVITGSANLSHTDMSGFNSNSIIVINSPEVAKFYSNEFEQLYNGKFHNDKLSEKNKSSNNIKVFFSPQDKGIENGILPLIKNANSYIYIPSFVITENRIKEELIKAKQRGVDIKIIADALNTSTKHSKHKELRASGILVKAENYAGKMHSKTIIIDDKYLVIGSMNFSNSGENKNDENMIILQNDDAAKFYKQFFLYQWDKIPDKWLKSTPRAEGYDSIGSCYDGIDNNYDNKTDMEDEACRRTTNKK